MFIRKKTFSSLVDELYEQRKKIDNLQDCVAAMADSVVSLRNDETDVLFGFAEDIAELQDKTSDLSDFDELEGEYKAAYAEQLRQAIGLINISNF